MNDERIPPERVTVPSVVPPSMGQIAHNAWWTTLVKDCPPPSWEQLDPEERAAWDAAAMAVGG